MNFSEHNHLPRSGQSRLPDTGGNCPELLRTCAGADGRERRLLQIAMPQQFAAHLRQIAMLCREAGGRALVVGGGVRDALLGLPMGEMDIEVFGIGADALEALLAKHYVINAVGRSFGVFKLKGLDLDISLPRRESKQGSGHRGFVVEGDPSMGLCEAAQRRDFTINTLYWDPLGAEAADGGAQPVAEADASVAVDNPSEADAPTAPAVNGGTGVCVGNAPSDCCFAWGELLDPCGGLADLQAKVLRHVSPAFAEDPLRVLRAMQFLARFELAIAPETLELCSRIEPEGLPVERLFGEWSKLVVKGVRPSLGLAFLQDCGWLRYYPELEALVGCPQDPQWHPEGDVWTHTLHCMDAFAAARTGDAWEDLVVGLAVLLHDIGKPLTTFTDEDGRIRSPRHDSEGAKPAEAFLHRISRHQALVEEVLPLVVCHMHPAQFYASGAGDAAIRRLALRVKRIDRLVRVARADMGGRPPLSADFPAGDWLLQKAQSLSVADSAPASILLGRHLIEHFALKPGPQMGELLKAAYEAQLEGQVCDLASALAFVRARLNR